MNGGFEKPRNGKKNDKAHPPIHPTAHVSNLAGNDKRVYDLITRRFLACCSTNATGMQTTIDIDICGEEFSTSGMLDQIVYVHDLTMSRSGDTGTQLLGRLRL